MARPCLLIAVEHSVIVSLWTLITISVFVIGKSTPNHLLLVSQTVTVSYSVEIVVADLAECSRLRLKWETRTARK